MLLERTPPTEPVAPTAPPSPSDRPATRASDRTTLLAVAAVFGASTGVLYPVQLILPAPLALAVAALLGIVAAWTTRDRVTGPWLGATAWAATCTAATVAVLDLANTERHQLGLTLGLVALASAASLGVWAWDAVRRRGVSPAQLVENASRIFLEPSTALAPIMVGAGMALPLIGSYGPEVTDPDSAWIVASTQETRDYGLGLLQQTQEVLLPQVTIGALLSLGGYQVAVAFVLATLIALVAVTAFLGQRISGHGAGAFAAAATLLSMPTVVDRADRLPMYAASFAFAYGSVWLLHQAMANPSRHRWLPLVAGLGFVLAFEAHNVGQIFLLAPVLLLVLHPWRRALRPLLATFATIAVVSIPRIAINLSDGGLRKFRGNYNTWAIEKGYLRQINQDFFGQNVEKSPIRYLGNIPGMIEQAVGGRGLFLLLALPVALAALRSGRRAQIFTAACAGMFFLALLIASPATYSRYVTPLAAGLAVLAGVGVAMMVREPGTSRTLGKIMVAVLLVAAFYQMSASVTRKAQEHVVVADGPLPTLANHIDDDRRVLGIRSHELARVDPSIRTLFGRKMTEEDFITYATWPSDDQVTALLDRLDVGWIYVLPDPNYEVLYHQTWLEPTYGETVNHPLRLAASDAFCLVEDIGGYRLYRYGPCRPGDQGVDGPTINDPSLNPFRELAGLPLIPDPDSDVPVAGTPEDCVPSGAAGPENSDAGGTPPGDEAEDLAEDAASGPDEGDQASGSGCEEVLLDLPQDTEGEVE